MPSDFSFDTFFYLAEGIDVPNVKDPDVINGRLTPSERTDYFVARFISRRPGIKGRKIAEGLESDQTDKLSIFLSLKRLYDMEVISNFAPYR